MAYFFNTSDINQTFIIEGDCTNGSGDTGSFTACTSVSTNNLISCDFDTSISLSGDIITNKSIIPLIDSVNDLGSSVRRFRKVNTVSGDSTVWFSSEKIITPELDLGLDSMGNIRKITANNSIIQNDLLNGGVY
jgi:hypothetical protein